MLTAAALCSSIRSAYPGRSNRFCALRTPRARLTHESGGRCTRIPAPRVPDEAVVICVGPQTAAPHSSLICSGYPVIYHCGWTTPATRCEPKSRWCPARLSPFRCSPITHQPVSSQPRLCRLHPSADKRGSRECFTARKLERKHSTQSEVGWRDFWPLDEGAPVARRTRTALFCRRNQSLIIVSISVSFADVRRRPTAVTGTELQRVQTVPTIGGPLISGLESV
jgi:hypothetical protein